MPSCSIRCRLTLWYGLALTFVLAGSAVFWYAYLSRSLMHQVDERLLNVAQNLSARHSSHHHIGPDASYLDFFDEFIHQQAQGELIQVMDPRGMICCRSTNLGEASLPLSKDALRHNLDGTPWYETHRFGDEDIRLLTFPLQDDQGKRFIFLIASNLKPMRQILSNLLLVVVTCSPLALLAMLYGGWFLGQRAMSPIEQMIREVHEIDANNLNRRLPVGASRDEVSQMAETFNSLLDRLQSAFDKIRQFTADASHELRTPLAILRGETEVTLSWAKGPEDYRRTLESNLEEIDRLGRIIEDLLTLSRSEAGTAPLNLDEFSLGELLQELYEQGKIYGEPRTIGMELRLLVDQDLLLRGDRSRLHQLFLNLIANAVKYSVPGASVELSLSQEGEQAVVAVTDHGIGIAPEHLPLIFDRFYRVDEARNRQVGGTGLGLAIVKWIVDAHQGTITATSTPGAGSTFTVRLPLAGPSSGAESASRAPEKKN